MNIATASDLIGEQDISRLGRYTVKVVNRIMELSVCEYRDILLSKSHCESVSSHIDFNLHLTDRVMMIDQ